MSPLASWALIGALTFLSFYAAHHLGAGVDWVLDHMGWTSSSANTVWLLEDHPSESEAFVVAPRGYVRCPECGYFLPSVETDHITGICDDCSDGRRLGPLDIDAEWQDLQRALEDERREGEDHR